MNAVWPYLNLFLFCFCATQLSVSIFTRQWITQFKCISFQKCSWKCPFGTQPGPCSDWLFFLGLCGKKWLNGRHSTFSCGERVLITMLILWSGEGFPHSSHSWRAMGISKPWPFNTCMGWKETSSTFYWWDFSKCLKPNPNIREHILLMKLCTPLKCC